MKPNALSHQFSPDLPGSEVSPILPSSSVVGSATWQVEERVHEAYTVTSMVPHHSGNVTAGHPRWPPHYTYCHGSFLQGGHFVKLPRLPSAVTSLSVMSSNSMESRKIVVRSGAAVHVPGVEGFLRDTWSGGESHFWVPSPVKRPYRED